MPRPVRPPQLFKIDADIAVALAAGPRPRRRLGGPLLAAAAATLMLAWSTPTQADDYRVVATYDGGAGSTSHATEEEARQAATVRVLISDRVLVIDLSGRTIWASR